MHHQKRDFHFEFVVALCLIFFALIFFFHCSLEPK